ncbi:MAG: DUF1080 domain-containing protein [Planctomycetes bacterium]|nr:DUF1080 domain-containing protein [Planctomycetota bacterium]
MFHIALSIVSCAIVAFAGAPDEAAVQGLYEGSCKSDSGVECKLEVRVVAQGKGQYKVFIRETLPDGKLVKVNGEAKAEGDTVAFKAKVGDTEWAGTYADGGFTGACPTGCKLTVKRVERESPTLGAKPPEGAILLLAPDPNASDEMTKRKGKDGKEAEWKLFEDGGVLIPKGGMSTRRAFEGSFKLHVEFKNPFMPERHSQSRGNSGVFLPNGDEIQVLDSFGDMTYLGGGCGGIYKYKDPDTMEELPIEEGKPPFKFNLASLPPGQWQTYDIEYRVEKPGAKPRVTVLQNGMKIHDNFELKGARPKGGFSFQDHGCPVQYRNIWVLPLGDK